MPLSLSLSLVWVYTHSVGTTWNTVRLLCVCVCVCTQAASTYPSCLTLSLFLGSGHPVGNPMWPFAGLNDGKVVPQLPLLQVSYRTHIHICLCVYHLLLLLYIISLVFLVFLFLNARTLTDPTRLASPAPLLHVYIKHRERE